VLGLSATSASLTLGTGLTGAISDGGDADTLAITGGFNLTSKAFSFTADQMALSIPEVLTAAASGLSVAYNPNGSSDQTLMSLTSLTATIVPLNATATVTGLVIRQNGFSLFGADIDLPTFTLGGLLTINSPRLTFESVAYTVGGNLSGRLGLGAGGASIALGTALTATITDGPDLDSLAISGGFDLATKAFALSADQLNLQIPGVLTASAAGVAIGYNPAGASSQEVVRINSLVAQIIPISTSVTVTGLVIRPDGFSLDSGSVALPNVTLGSFLTITTPTLTVENLAYTSGGPLTGRLGLAAGSASLSLGSALTATITDGPDADNLAISGGFDLTSKAFRIDADQMALSIPGLLTSSAAGLLISYDPDGPAGQTLVELASFEARVIPIDVTVTLTDLVIRENGFSVGRGGVELPDFSLGSFLTITNPTIEFIDVAYTSGGSLQGTIGVAASTASLFPGKSFSASISDGPDADTRGISGGLNLTTGAFSLQVDQFSLAVSDVLTARASGVTIAYDPEGPEVQTLVTITTGTVSFPRFGLEGSVSQLVVRTDGFKFGSATITATATVRLGAMFEMSGFSVTITNFGVNYATGVSFDGAITLGASSLKLFPGSTVFSATGTGLTGTFDFSGGGFNGFRFTAAQVEVTAGSFLKFTAGNVALNSDPGPGEYVASFGILTVELTTLGISGSGGNFAIAADGSLVTLPGFGVTLSAGAGASSGLKWPDWLPIQITTLGLAWRNFAANPADFQITLSASVTGLRNLPVSVSGSVEGAVIDIGLLTQGKFPLVDLRSASITVSGNLFGGEITGTLFLGILKTDASGNEIPVGNTTTAVANSVLYGGIIAGFSLAGLSGFEIRIGISELGPLTVYVSAGIPILLEPNSGLSITNFRAGVTFNATLPSITDPLQLRGPAFQPQGELTPEQWQAQLKQGVLNQIRTNPGGDFWAAFTQPMKIEGGATLYSAYASTNTFRADVDIIISTDGKFLINARMVYGNALEQRGILYFDLSRIRAGTGTILLLIDQPANPPVLTIRGAVTFGFTRLDGTAVTATNQADNFELRISGGVDVQALSLAKLTIEGSVVLRFSPMPNPTRFDLEMSGELYVTLLGQRVSLAGAAGVLRLDTSGGDVKMWGALAITSNLQFLERVGIFANVSTIFRLNLTGQDRQEVLNIPGRGAITVDLKALSYSFLLEGFLVVRTGGQDWFRLEGSFGMEISADDGLAMFAQGRLIVAPSLNLFSFNFQGFLQLSSRGIAAKLDLSLTAGLPAQYGVSLAASFTLTLNTTGRDVTYTLPPSIVSIPGGGQSRTIAISASPAGGRPSPYLQINATGTMTVQGFVIEGQFSLLVSPTVIDLQASGTMAISVAGTRLFLFNVAGGFRIDQYGVAAAVNLTLSAGLPSSLGFVLSATFRFELNTTNQARTLAGINLAAGRYAKIRADGFLQVAGLKIEGYFEITLGTNVLSFQAFASLDLRVGNTSIVSFNVGGGFRVDNTGIAAAFGLTLRTNFPSGRGYSFSLTFRLEVNTTNRAQTLGGIALEAGVYGRIMGSGNLVVGGFTIAGSFKFTVGVNVLNVEATATMDLRVGSTTLFGFNVAGGFVLDAGGMAAAFSLSLRSGLPSGLGFSFNVTFRLEINTTTATRTIAGISLAPNTVRVFASGNLQLAGAFRFDGSFSLTLAPDRLVISVNASMSLFTATVNVRGDFGLFSDGLAANFSLTLPSISTSFFSLNGTFTLQINTTNRTIFGVPRQTFLVKVTNARLTVVGVTLSGSLSIGVVGGQFNMTIPDSDPLTVSLANFFTVRVSGFVNGNGTFRLTGTLAINLGRNDLVGISGTLSVTIANAGLVASLSGRAYIFNTNVAAVSGNLTVTASDFRLSVNISFNFTVASVLRINGSGTLVISRAGLSISFTAGASLFNAINATISGGIDTINNRYYFVGTASLYLGNSNLGVSASLTIKVANYSGSAAGISFGNGFSVAVSGRAWAGFKIAGHWVGASATLNASFDSSGRFSVRVNACISLGFLGSACAGVTVNVDLRNGFRIWLSDIANATVFLDVNRNGQIDAGEPVTQTDANGNFSFGEDELSGSVAPSEAALGSLARYDTNRNGRLDEGTEGQFLQIGGTNVQTGETRTTALLLEGAGVTGATNYLDSTVFFDANLNGILDADEPRTLTDSTGAYAFFTLDLSAGLGLLAVYDRNQNGILDDEEGQLVMQGGVFVDPVTGERQPAGGILDSNLLAGLLPVTEVERIYWDANKNLRFDEGEVFVVPDANGFFSFLDLQAGAVNYLGKLKPFDRNNNGVIDPEEGEFVIVGGFDKNTGLPNEQTIRIPAADYGRGLQATANPLSELQSVLELSGLTHEEAMERIQAAFGLPTQVDVAIFDPRTAAPEDAPIVPLVLTGSEKLNTLFQVGGAALAADATVGRGALIQELVTRLRPLKPSEFRQTADGQLLFQVQVELADVVTVREILSGAAGRLKLDLAADRVQAIAQIIAALNQQVDAAVQNIKGGDLQTALGDIKAVAQTSGAEAAASIARGGAEPVATAAEFAGEKLLAKLRLFEQPPFLAPLGNQSGDGKAFSVSLRVENPNGLVETVKLEASADNATLLPAGSLVLTGSGSERLLTVAPAAGISGIATVTVIAQVSAADGRVLSRAESFRLEVATTNRPPQISEIGDQTIAANTPTAPIAFRIEDPEVAPEALVVQVTSDNHALLSPAGVTLSGAGAERRLVLRPTTDQDGIAGVTITVSDGVSDTSRSFLLKVTARNDAPMVELVPRAVYVDPTSGEALVLRVPEGSRSPVLEVRVSDREAAPESLSFSVRADDAALLGEGMLILEGVGAERTLTLTPAVGRFGTTRVEVSVSDGEHTTTKSFTVKVTPVNAAPVLDPISDLTTPEDRAAEVAVRFTDDKTAPDQVTLTASAGDPGLVSSLSFRGTGGDRVLVITPAPGQLGRTLITVTASDGDQSSSTSFELTVDGLNAAPRIAPIADQIINRDSASGLIRITISDRESLATDLTLTASSSNPALIQADALVLGGFGINRTLVITPVPGQIGEATLSLTVSDGERSSTSRFQVTVEAIDLHIVSWASSGGHGAALGELPLIIPDDGTFSEPRVSGLSRMLITFNQPIDPASFTADQIFLSGMNAERKAVDLSRFTWTASLSDNNTVGVITFNEKLPDQVRYRVALRSVSTVGGGALTGDRDRVMTALLGDVTGDRKVDAADVAVTRSLRRVGLIEAEVASQLRADLNGDGWVNNTDVGGLYRLTAADVRHIPEPRYPPFILPPLPGDQFIFGKVEVFTRTLVPLRYAPVLSAPDLTPKAGAEDSWWWLEAESAEQS
jgi:hypothetical protein